MIPRGSSISSGMLIRVFVIGRRLLLLFLLFNGGECTSSRSSFKDTATFHGEYDPNNNCYAMAVYDELMRAIEIINGQTASVVAGGKEEVDGFGGGERRKPGNPTTSLLKKFQEDEDEGGGGGGEDLGIPPIVPMVFKVIGSALSLNSSALTESSFGIIPDRLSNQITSVLGGLASTIFGSSIIPKTTRPPPPRRRRRTTTTSKPETSSTAEPTSTVEALVETSPAENVSSTTEQLFKESSLGELPVYASAYAPNYVATTPYPVYASNFLHVLYAAPTTPSTTTTTTTTTEPPTTVNPNSYGVNLPFDYHEFTTRVTQFYPPGIGVNATTTSLDYEEYEYEGGEENTGSTGSSRRFDSQENSGSSSTTSSSFGIDSHEKIGGSTTSFISFDSPELLPDSKKVNETEDAGVDKGGEEKL